MCTLSWFPQEGAYSIWFNRDERVTRKQALSPERHERSSVPFVAPTDAEAGGTWIGVNAFGVSVCLANRYGSTIRLPPSDRVSRGLLVLSLLDLPTQHSVATAVERVDLTRYEPFTLGIFEPESSPLMLAWDGASFTRASSCKAGLLLTSSAVDQERVVASRLGVQATALSQEPLSAALLDRLHSSHEPDRSSISICMHRPDAATQSLSRIDVGPETIRFRYTPGPPCTVAAEHPLTLTRVASSPTS